ncbi:hypothetical protein FB567DRAFT_31232 [Paraphoma chrysanthemicola]|uniref:Endothelin-converting enzyme 1 n=1 Tax=Paraphoma chrysanthemicola TaxID=798071 RepID=A0A8K0RI84_9PLEO|nr:hypothetical protein FB567DRAFT_31232 [Paraphoma chrysanthemicola]
MHILSLSTGVKQLFFASLLSRSAFASSPNDTCLTSSCIQTSARILRTLHEDYKSIDPCEDFGQYACGGFAAQWPFRETLNTIGSIQATNSHILRTILEGPYSPSNSTPVDPSDQEAFNMVVKNYNSCMNASSDAPDLAGLQEIVAQIVELFPSNSTDATSNDTLTERDMDAFAGTIAYLAGIGVPVFGEFWTIPDPQNPDVLVPSFGLNPGGNGSDHALPSRIISISELATVPNKTIANILTGVAPDYISNGTVTDVAQNIVDLAAAIGIAEAAVAGTDPSALEKIYHTSTVADAVKLAPALAFDRVIEKLSPSDYELDRMLFRVPEIFANVSTLVSETPKSTLRALFIVMAYKSYEPFVTPSKLTGMERWENICYTYVDESLPWLASKLFLDATYSDESRENLETMTEELKDALIKRVSENDWMANDTKKLVQEKLSEVRANIGYPQHTPDAWNSTSLLAYYSPINITDSLFSNALSIRRWAAARAFRALDRPVDATLWPEFGVHAFNAQARYYPHYNSIQIPAGITQRPIYLENAPSYITYGSIGLVAGHEITHGFDTNGREWDNNRRYKEWWDEASEVAFTNLTKCFVDQFNAIPVIDETGQPVLNQTGQQAYVNGTLTITENIADAGGMASAWDAWRTHEAVSPSPRLPGLGEFSKEQLFFLAAGQMWCSKSTHEDLLTHIKTDFHAPAFARVEAVSRNSKGFREAWGCKVKEPECEIW